MYLHHTCRYGLMMRKEHHRDVLQLIERAAECLVRQQLSAASDDRNGDSGNNGSASPKAQALATLAEGPPPLVKCASLEPLPQDRRPVVLLRAAGWHGAGGAASAGANAAAGTAAGVFQYKAGHPGAAAAAGAAAFSEDKQVLSGARCTQRSFKNGHS